MTEFVTLTMCRELMDTQAKAYKDLVLILVDNLKSDMKDLRREIDELKAAAQFSSSNLDDISKKLRDLELKQEQQMKSMDDCNHSLGGLIEKQNYQENYGRRKNLKILGLPDSQNSTESWDESGNIVKEKVKELLKIEEDLNIERAHRVGKYQKAYTKSDGTRVPEKVRPIVARFSSWKQKDAIVKAARSLKPTGVMFLDDLSDLTLAKRKAQIPQMLEARKEGKIAYFSVDKLIIKERLTGFGQPHSPFAGSEDDEVIINRHDE